MNDITTVEAQASTLPEEAPKPLGYHWFVLQVLAVAAGYLAFSVLPIGVFGLTSAGVALSVTFSALGGICAAWMILRLGTDWQQALGLKRVTDWQRTLGLAALATGGTFAIFAAGSGLTALGLKEPQVDEVISMATQSPGHLALWIVAVAWIGAGFGEEVIWRGFLMDRLSRLRGIGSSVTLVIIVQGVIFGLAHFYQGWSGILLTGAVGLWLGWIYIKAGRNIWATVLAHAAVDTVMLCLGYAEAQGWIAG